MIVPSDPTINTQRKLLVELTARYACRRSLSLRAAVVEGGLMSYGIDIVELFRQSAIYATEILKGEKPADLPVQSAVQVRDGDQHEERRGQLGLEIPASLLATADEVIE